MPALIASTAAARETALARLGEQAPTVDVAISPSGPARRTSDLVALELADLDAQEASRALARVPGGPEPLIEPGELFFSFDTDVTGALSGRNQAARARLAREGGGSPRSEEAVARGLRWLAAHQRTDGSWRFDHTLGPCQGLCRNPGSVGSTTGATAIAILPFLGAGHTHLEGEYGEVVRAGLDYLQARMLVTPEGGDLQEGTMYAQGLATIVLCETYAMTRDRALAGPAQRAIDFVVYSQDKKGGGWRYFPGQPGDTTVTGWQLMALKCGQMAYLRVPPQTIFDATRFLAGVQDDYGARYGYTSPGKEPTTSAIGLLCRMYTGWRPDNVALGRGVKFLGREGPSPDNMYYNFYATQVMHHWGGDEWKAWNYRMRDFLIATQAADGHESGSWFFSGGRGDQGGRLYNTAMAVMTLEVYYRYLPLYGPDAVNY